VAKRLLVVDDEAKLLKAVAVTLRKEGYDVSTARNGGEALVRIAEALPDLVVCDIRMPGIDGYALARHLRSHPRTELVPIVFLTAKDERKDRLAGLRAGVDAYLTKPFDPEELLVVVGNILHRMERTSAEIARIVSSATGGGAQPSFLADTDLTEAENRVARLVAMGLSNKEIGVELGVSVRTVEGHISNILAKKSWNNRVDIARHMLARGNADPPT
jgi:DNA-binding NarL/FixJ family response regulator